MADDTQSDNICPLPKLHASETGQPSAPVSSQELTELKSEGNEVAVESVDIAYETLIISAP